MWGCMLTLFVWQPPHCRLLARKSLVRPRKTRFSSRCGQAAGGGQRGASGLERKWWRLTRGEPASLARCWREGGGSASTTGEPKMLTLTTTCCTRKPCPGRRSWLAPLQVPSPRRLAPNARAVSPDTSALACRRWGMRGGCCIANLLRLPGCVFSSLLPPPPLSSLSLSRRAHERVAGWWPRLARDEAPARAGGARRGDGIGAGPAYGEQHRACQVMSSLAPAASPGQSPPARRVPA